MGRLLSFRKAKSLRSPFFAGDIVSVVTHDGRFGIMKILAVDTGGVHTKLYSQRFVDRPLLTEMGELSILPYHSQPGLGLSLSHFPLTHQYFLRWQPILLINRPVTDEDLWEYRIWLNSKGGYF